ncbi:hypothetical protein [Tumebacillus lipolyticus]|uniref:Lipoprotein n=1 Tax=Tumebacillus lipolyticus TaxID=1280370 RepID=A0ABW4ZSG0_9BACL
MKKRTLAQLILFALLLTGCEETIEQRHAAAVKKAIQFNMAMLDYQHRTSNDDVRGLEDATDRARTALLQELKTPEEILQAAGGQDRMPEVKDVKIAKAIPIGKDGEEGYIINTRILYYPDVYRYVQKVGLKIVPVDGEWKVDQVVLDGELGAS